MSEQTLNDYGRSHGQIVQVANREWDGARDGLAPDQNGRGRLRADDLRPCVDEHRVHQERDHVY